MKKKAFSVFTEIYSLGGDEWRVKLYRQETPSHHALEIDSATARTEAVARAIGEAMLRGECPYSGDCIK